MNVDMSPLWNAGLAFGLIAGSYCHIVNSSVCFVSDPMYV